jgi:hypothetical protein
VDDCPPVVVVVAMAGAVVLSLIVVLPVGVSTVAFSRASDFPSVSAAAGHGPGLVVLADALLTAPSSAGCRLLKRARLGSGGEDMLDGRCVC